MAYYVRKIARAKWSVLDKSADKVIDNYRADAIANDMRTTNDTLSFWKVDSLSDEDMEPVIVINSLMGDTIAKIDLLCVPEEMVEEFSFEQSDGDTIVVNYKKLHYNLIQMTIKKLLDFAKNVVLLILFKEEQQDIKSKEETLIKRITETKQLELIAKWLDRGEFSYDELKERQKNAVDKYRLRKQREISG